MAARNHTRYTPFARLVEVECHEPAVMPLLNDDYTYADFCAERDAVDKSNEPTQH